MAFPGGLPVPDAVASETNTRVWQEVDGDGGGGASMGYVAFIIF